MTNFWFYFFLMVIAVIGGQDIAKGCFTVMVANAVINKWCKTKVQAALCLIVAVLVAHVWIWGIKL